MKKVRIQVMFSEELAQRVRAKSEETGTSLSGCVAFMVGEYLKQEKTMGILEDVTRLMKEQQQEIKEEEQTPESDS